MSTANDYLKMAEECYRLAKEAKTDNDRQALLDLARNWIEAASQQGSADEPPAHPPKPGQ
jgi:hypothetical protein